MAPTDLINHLRRQPFRALRLHLSDETSYEVRHPELALVTLTEVAVALPSAAGDVPERMVYRDPFHIRRVEPLPENIAEPRQGNGQTG